MPTFDPLVQLLETKNYNQTKALTTQLYACPGSILHPGKKLGATFQP